LSRAHIDRVNAELRKARRWGITDLDITTVDLIERSDIGHLDNYYQTATA